MSSNAWSHDLSSCSAVGRFAGSRSRHRSTACLKVRIFFSRDSEAAGIEADVLDELASGVAENRRERAARGELPSDLDPEVVSQALVGLLSRVIAWWVEDPRRAARETVIETLTRIQLHGTHPAPTSAADASEDGSA